MAQDIRALITAAGMGKRFGALTRHMNKSLLRIGGKPLILRILQRLRESGIREVIVVTGHESEHLERALNHASRILYNPFYQVSGILGSFWIARWHLEGRPFLFTTSDHFFHPHVLRDCLRCSSDVGIVVQRKKSYTKEDAKVIIQGSRVIRIGKDIPPETCNGEFGGMVLFSGKTSSLFYKELQIRLQKKGLRGYMMEILQTLHDRHGISISYALCEEGSRIELDSVHDLIQARRMDRAFKKERTP